MGSDSRRCDARLAYWLFPILLIFQYLGDISGHTLAFSGAYLGLFVFCVWHVHPGSMRPSAQSEPKGRFVGLILALLGVGLAGVGIAHFLYEPDFFGEAVSHVSWLGVCDAARILIFAAAWPLGIGLTLLMGERVGLRAYLRVCAALGLATLVILALIQRHQGMAVFPAESTLTTASLWAAGVSLGLLMLVAPRHPAWWLVGLLVPGLLVRIAGMATWEIDPAVRDMLPLVMSAQDSLLAGEHPYRIHQMQTGSELPLTYLPAMWLLCLPARLLELDIRWTSILADVLVVVSLWLVANGGLRGEANEGRGVDWRQAAAFGFGMIWLYSPSVHWNFVYAEPHIWVGVLAGLLTAVAFRRWWIVAVLLGLAVCTRHYGVVVLPFILVAMLRDLGWRQSIPRLAVSGSVAALLLAPFVLSDSESFWFGTFRWLREYGPAHQGWFHGKLGFAGPMYEHGLEAWQSVAQIGVVALGTVAAWCTFRRRDNRRFFAIAGTTYLLFIMFNGLIWYSFYFAAFLFVGFAVASPDPGPDPPGRAVGGAAWWLAAVIFAVCVGLGGWMTYTLVSTQTPSGFDEARAYLEDELREGDLLVDRSDRRLKFVEGERIFDKSEEPGGVEVIDELFAPDAPAPERLFEGEGASGRWWMVTGEHSDHWADALGQLGSVEADRQFGDVRVVGVDVGRMPTRLTQRLEDLKVTFEPQDGPSRSLTPRDADEEIDKDNPAVSDKLPGWVKAAPKECRFDGHRREMLYVHPTEEGALRLHWEDVPLGDTLWLTAGIEHPAVRWQRAEVEVVLFVDGRRIGRFDIPNLPGVRWRGYSTKSLRGEHADVDLVLTTEDDAQRWTCLDAFVLER